MIIKGNRNLLRDYLHVKDAAKIITLSIGKGINDTINVATGHSVSVNEVATMIKEALGTEVKIHYLEQNDGKSNIRFDIAKLKSYYKYEFKTIENEIKKMCS